MELNETPVPLSARIDSMLNRFIASSAATIQKWARNTNSILNVVIGNEVRFGGCHLNSRQSM